MQRLLYGTALYVTVLQRSLDAKEVLWVCSPCLGTGAHRVFSQEILKTPPVDIRFVFRVTDATVKRREVDPYEIQYITEHFKGANIKGCDDFNANIYIFDNTALVTSAQLTEAAFERDTEVGTLIEGPEAEEIKNIFTQNLWNPAKSIGELKKYKLMWNLTQKPAYKSKPKKTKPKVIKDWTNDYINTWYIGVSRWISKNSERKIKKETNWRNLSVLGDVGYGAFGQLKLGDYAYLADLGKRGKVGVALIRVADKARVETDEGDYHFAFETEKIYELRRERFFEMLKNANISSKRSESILSGDQLKQVVDALSSIKRKRKRKAK
jgi:hypothetical protein